MKLSSCPRSGQRTGAPSIKALVASEYSGNRSGGWFHTPMLGNGAGSISGIIVGESNDIARCRSK